MKYSAKQIVNYIFSLLLAVFPFVCFAFDFIGQAKGYEIFGLIDLMQSLGQLNVLIVLLCVAMVLVMATSALVLVVTIGNIFASKIKVFSNKTHDIVININLVAVMLVFAFFMAFYFNVGDTSYIPVNLLVLTFGVGIISALSILSKNIWDYALAIFVFEPQVILIIPLLLLDKCIKKFKKKKPEVSEETEIENINQK